MTPRYCILLEVVGIDDDGYVNDPGDPCLTTYAISDPAKLDDIMMSHRAAISIELRAIPGRTYRWPDEDPYFGEEYGYA